MTAFILTTGALTALAAIGYRVRAKLGQPDPRPVEGQHRAAGPPVIFGGDR